MLSLFATNRVLVWAILSFLFISCSKPESTQSANRISAEGSNPTESSVFVDLTFSIRDQKRLTDGSQALQAHALKDGKEIGVMVVLGKQWKKIFMGSFPGETYQGKVTLQSLGVQSDTLIQVLDKLYGTKLRPATIRANSVVDGISLEGNPSDLAKGITKIKLFFEPDSEDKYAELFLDIDLPKGVIQINEKDAEYRLAIIKALQDK